jgi:hypothetical protein
MWQAALYRVLLEDTKAAVQLITSLFSRAYVPLGSLSAVSQPAASTAEY